jgi:hypothetical protein
MLLSLSSMCLSSLHVRWGGRVSFQCCIAFHCLPGPVYFLSPAEAHSGCFQDVWAVMNKAPVHMCLGFFHGCKFLLHLEKYHVAGCCTEMNVFLI